MRNLAVLPFFLAGALAAADADLSSRFYNAIRADDQAAVSQLIAGGASVNLRDARGNTPLMHAAAIGSPAMVQKLLEAGADAKARNSLDSTALMWCTSDAAKVRLLLQHGADPNARTRSGASPLFIAAAHDGNLEAVRLLLDKGADPKAQGPAGATAALMMAANAGDLAVARLLIEKGADAKAKGPNGLTALMSAASSGSPELVKLLLSHGADPNAQSGPVLETVRKGNLGLGSFTALIFAVNTPSPEMVRLLLEAGADVNTPDVRGMTPLMLAVASDHADPRIVRLLLAKSPKMDARSKDGETALDWALRIQDPAIVPMITKASAGIAPARPQPVTVTPGKRDAASAIRKGVEVMQTTYKTFFREGGCVGCHAGNITSTVVASARAKGIAVDEPAAAELARATRLLQGPRANGMLQREDPPAVEILTHSLLGLADERVEPDPTIDAMVHNVAAQQRADGSWGTFGIMRPPTADGHVSTTAAAIRVLRHYQLPARRAEFESRIARAARWLEAARATTTEDAVMQLLGAAWAGRDRAVVDRAARRVLALQRPGGGWAQLPQLQPDAYATGTALYALQEAGIKTSAYQKGVAFLLATQAEDGTWYVKSRAPKFQPYFESGFPYGHDQWISQWATGYALVAITHSLPNARAAR